MYSSPASFDTAYGESGTPGVILRRGLVALAVDRAAARGEDEPRPGGASGFEDAHRPDDVDLGVEDGPLDRRADVGLGGEMEDDVGPELSAERFDGGVADVELVELGAGGEVVARAGGEVVDDVHLVAAREQRVDDMRADEARAACDERPHCASSRETPLNHAVRGFAGRDAVGVRFAKRPRSVSAIPARPASIPSASRPSSTSAMR